MINYSIIIPHKDIPDLLQRCLDSIPVRDDVQVIVVDDNSNVEKVNFDYFPQWRGQHYETYFTKEGRGAGYARNVGLEYAVGKWVLFVDADDFLSDNADRIFDENVDCDADIVFFRHKAVMLDNPHVVSNRVSYYNEWIDEYFEFGEEYKLRLWLFVPWGKFIRRSLIEANNIHFDEVRYSNDCYFSTLLGIVAKKIIVCEDMLYILTESSISLTSEFCSKQDELECRAEVFFRTTSLVYSNNQPIDQEQAFRYLGRLITQNRTLFAKYSHLSMGMLGISKWQLIQECFRNNSPISKIKRSLYAYLIL